MARLDDSNIKTIEELQRLIQKYDESLQEFQKKVDAHKEDFRGRVSQSNKQR